MRTLGAVLAVMLSGCGSGDGDGWHQAGECDPPAGVDLPIGAATIVENWDADAQCYFDRLAGLVVIGSQAEWDAQFSCATPPPAPVDFATQRAAIITLDCTPFDLTFAIETADDIAIGIHSHVSGACLGNVDVVPLPRSNKAVRLAECHDECSDCPPVP